jgi:ribose/xylose/arabinose/galactoside ABC-type transport system permease subunit
MAVSSFAQIVVKGVIVVLAVLLSAISVRWAAAGDVRTARRRILRGAEPGGST